jgi:hypothetical protein
LTFQPGQFVRFAQDFARLKAKIHKLHPSYLYQMSSSLVNKNLHAIRFFDEIAQKRTTFFVLLHPLPIPHLQYVLQPRRTFAWRMRVLIQIKSPAWGGAKGLMRKSLCIFLFFGQL